MNRTLVVARSFRTAALLAVLAASPAFAQKRTDATILIDVRNVFLQQPVFRGMAVEPAIHDGVVTLSGTVTSEAARELASDRVGEIHGVRTVLNNLTVVDATARPVPPAVPATSPAAAAGSMDQVKIITLTPPAVVPVRIRELINTKTAKAGDTFHGLTAADVYQSSVLLIPAGTPVMGRVVSSKAARPFVGFAQLSLELTSIRLSVPQVDDKTLPLATLPLSNQGGRNGGLLGSSVGVSNGAGAYGSTPASGSQPGTQIVLQPETILQFTTANPLVIAVQFKNGLPVPSPAATGDAVLPAVHDAGTPPPASQPH